MCWGATCIVQHGTEPIVICICKNYKGLGTIVANVGKHSNPGSHTTLEPFPCCDRVVGSKGSEQHHAELYKSWQIAVAGAKATMDATEGLTSLKDGQMAK
jgi:hypothetical protein